MSKEELSRLEVIKRLEEKRMRQRTAAEVLGISIRQVKRLLPGYRREGAAGLVSKQRGQPSHHQLDGERVRQALDLLKGSYADFGPTLAHEKLVERHGVELSLGSVRKMMIEEGIWKPKKRREASVHPLRERRACFGELVQMDGSDHDWFEGRSERCTLLVMIDDATGQLGALRFVAEETFFGYCALLREDLQAHGKPAGLYTDKHGIFRVNLPNVGSGDNLTQFACASAAGTGDVPCKTWKSRSCVPTRPRPKAGSNAQTRPSRIAWSRRCVCDGSTISSRATPTCQTFGQISTLALPSPPAVLSTPIAPCPATKIWIRSWPGRRPAPSPKT